MAQHDGVSVNDLLEIIDEWSEEVSKGDVTLDEVMPLWLQNLAQNAFDGLQEAVPKLIELAGKIEQGRAKAMLADVKRVIKEHLRACDQETIEDYARFMVDIEDEDEPGSDDAE